MAEANDIRGRIHQNLKDAGCDAQTTKQCMALAEKGDLRAMLPVLTRYRSTLLGAIHARQKQMDCLDYLLYKIEKEMQ